MYSRMEMSVKVSRVYISLLYIVIILTLQSGSTEAKCIVQDGVCDCSNTDINNLEFDCTGATSLVLKSKSHDNWPSGVKLFKMGIINLTLSGNELTTIPIEHLPANLEVLVLANNKIEYIAANQLSTLTKLKVLDISNNIISNMHADAFVGLCNLEELSLKRNNLDNFKNITIALKETPSLKILDLSENFFQHVFLPKFLKSLEVLNLRHNIISVVSVTSCTYKLPNLKYLNFENNNLTSFPKSIADSLQNTQIMLLKNPLRCDCEVLRPLIKFNTTGITCMIKKGIVLTMKAALVPGCQVEVAMDTRDTTYSTSLIISSDSYVSKRSCSDKIYCSKLADKESVNECDETTEICWDLPETLCEDVEDLVEVTERGYLDVTKARYFNLTGLYTYNEYHTCYERHLYTVTGKVYLNNTYNTHPGWRRDNCAAASTPCSYAVSEDSLDAWKIALIVTGGISLILVVVIIVFVCRKTKRENPTFERNTDETIIRYPSSRYVMDSGFRSRFGVSHVVIDGYLTRRNVGDTASYIHIYDKALNVAEAEAQDYERLSIDRYGYLMANPKVRNIVSSQSRGYYVLLLNESIHEILIDDDGYLSVNQPDIHGTQDEDGYMCLTLRREQGDLGQLVTDLSNMYIKLESMSHDDDDVHIYIKLVSAWKLLNFWQNKEDENAM